MRILGNITHLDADESAFFERELEHIYSVTYDVKYPELKGRLFIPVSNEANPGARFTTYRQEDRRGKGKIIGNRGGDVPRVDVLGKEFTRPVRPIASSYGWDLFELRSAMMANRPLNAKRADAARRADEETLEDVALFGAPEYGIPDGFLNHPDVTITAAAGAWTGLSPIAIVAEISAMFSRVDTDTELIEEPNTLLLPSVAWRHISTTQLSTGSDLTILGFVMQNFPDLNAIEKWNRLDTAGGGSGTRAVLYKRDRNMLWQEIPSEFEQLPVEARGFDFIVNTAITTSGTTIPYPKAMQYLDGL